MRQRNLRKSVVENIALFQKGQARCSECQEVKEAFCFGKRSRNKYTGLRSLCKFCESKKAYSNYASPDKETLRLQARNNVLLSKGIRECRKCKQTLSLELFPKHPSNKDGYSHICKSCKKEKMKNWKIDENGKTISYTSWYRKTEKGRAKYNANQRKKRKLPHHKIRHNLKKRLKEILGKANSSKTIGCSGLELKAYLESKFQPGMTWENYGAKGWHIDHIIPLSAFDLTSQVQKEIACHYLNLQPLWAKDNIAKSDKIENDNLIDQIVKTIALKKGLIKEAT